MSLRMSDDTPVRKAVKYAHQPYQGPRGTPKFTWLSLILKQLANEHEHDLTWQKACAFAQDRQVWRNLCESYV